MEEVNMDKRVEVEEMMNKRVEVQEMNNGRTLVVTEKMNLSREMTKFLGDYEIEWLGLAYFKPQTGEVKVSAITTLYRTVHPKGKQEKILKKTYERTEKIKLSWEMTKFMYDYGIEWFELICFNPETNEVEISASTVIH